MDVLPAHKTTATPAHRTLLVHRNAVPTGVLCITDGRCQKGCNIRAPFKARSEHQPFPRSLWVTVIRSILVPAAVTCVFVRCLHRRQRASGNFAPPLTAECFEVRPHIDFGRRPIGVDCSGSSFMGTVMGLNVFA